MNLILTMAGKYSRFTNEGYKFPKYLLPWGNTNILSEILSELIKSTNFDNIFLVANKSDEIFMCHVKQIMKYHKIDTNNLIMISDTKGQAETAFIGINNTNSKINGNIIFHNIDTILYGRNFHFLKNELSKYPGFIDVFNSNNHEYSYVLEHNNIVEVISEKILISNLATSGLYGFDSTETFNKYYDDTQLFISDIYKKMILSGLKIKTGKIYSENETIVLGTPKDYIDNSNFIL